MDVAWDRAEEVEARQREIGRNQTCLYLIRDGETGWIKIGHSRNPARRLRQLTRQGTLMPKPCDFDLFFTSCQPVYVESLLQKHFETKRKRGEWFELDQDDVDLIKAICNDLYHDWNKTFESAPSDWVQLTLEEGFL